MKSKCQRVKIKKQFFVSVIIDVGLDLLKIFVRLLQTGLLFFHVVVFFH